MSDDIITVGTDVPAIADNTLIQLAEQAERRIDAMMKIKKMALKMTNRHDWTDQGGKPYMQVSGAEKVARLYGISWQIGEPVKEFEEGGHFSFTYKGYFSLAGATIEAIGTRSSKDGFFTKYSWDNGEKTTLPPSAIDAGDVKKAAYTNLLGNGISRILGLRNLTYEDLQEFAGITKEMIGKVEYKSKGKQADKDIPSEGAQVAEFVPSSVSIREGDKKDGTKWKKFIVKNGGGEYSTFSETFAMIAKKAITDKQKVKITYKDSKFGKDIENLVAVERQSGEDG
jgi:hypothetical protein